MDWVGSPYWTIAQAVEWLTQKGCADAPAALRRGALDDKVKFSGRRCQWSVEGPLMRDDSARDWIPPHAGIDAPLQLVPFPSGHSEWVMSPAAPSGERKFRLAGVFGGTTLYADIEDGWCDLRARCDEVIGLVEEAVKAKPSLGEVKPRAPSRTGPPRKLIEKAKEAIRQGFESGTFSRGEQLTQQEAMALTFGYKRTTFVAAFKEVLSELSELETLTNSDTK